jgi:hypothetical protein
MLQPVIPGQISRKRSAPFHMAVSKGIIPAGDRT